MPLTITNLSAGGHFEVEDESGKLIGTGRMHVSRKINGYCTLAFSQAVQEKIAKGYPLRVPIDWTADI